MDADLLAATAGVLLSLAFSYIPGAAEWYQTLTPTGRRLLMLGLLACAALGAFLLACSGYAGLFHLGLSCDERSAAGLLRALVLALTANQGAFLISPRRPNWAAGGASAGSASTGSATGASTGSATGASTGSATGASAGSATGASTGSATGGASTGSASTSSAGAAGEGV